MIQMRIIIFIFVIISHQGAFTHDIKTDIFLLDHEEICSDKKPYSECKNLRGSKLDGFIEHMEDNQYDKVSLVLQEKIRTRDLKNNHFFFKSINSYFHYKKENSNSSKLNKVAFFVFKIPTKSNGDVSLIRFAPGFDLRANKAKNVNSKFFDYSDALFLHPETKAIFSLILDGHQHQFRFKK